jgi:predicted amidohydrolase YtcJ
MEETLFIGGDLVTMTGQVQPEALAVRDGRIVEVGTRSDCTSALTSDFELIDLGGQTLMPGFVDAHCHPLMLGQSLSWVDCTPEVAPSIDELVNALMARVPKASTKNPVWGFGYHQGRLAEQRHPDRLDLDRVAIDRAVLVMHASGHGTVVNSWMLERIGIDDNTPNPEGGVIHRDAAGHATGLLWDSATDLITGNGGVKITKHGPNFHIPAPMPELIEALDVAQDTFLAKGVTSILDAQVSQREMSVWLSARDAGRLRIRANMLVLSSLLEQVLDLGLNSQLGDDLLTFLGIKCYADGSLTAYNANISAGYSFDPCHRGHIYHSDDELADLIGRAHAVGLQTGTHAQGDAAIRSALDAIEGAQNKTPRADARHRIEHCGLPSDDEIARMASLGVYSVNQPQHHYLYGKAVARAVGEGGDRYNPLQSLLSANVNVALSSDAPVAMPDPLLAVYAAVTRTSIEGGTVGDGSQCITVEQALQAHTIGGARSIHKENMIGSLEVGKFADLIVLDRNPATAPVESIPEIHISQTWVSGKSMNPAVNSSASS